MEHGNQRSSRSSGGGTGRSARSSKPSSAATEEAPSLVLHIDVDNGLTLSSNFARSIATAERASVCLETATAKEFVSHLLAEFMWGTLDPNNGSWLPVEGAPSCSPAGGDDSLITYGQYLRAKHTAEPLQNPQVCENIRKALQSFGQPPLKKNQGQGSGQRRPVRPESKLVLCSGEVTNSETFSSERVVETHAQLLKRMMLPLTLRLALGCEKANPVQNLRLDRNFKAANSEISKSTANSDKIVVGQFAPPVEEPKEERPQTVMCSYIERLKEGYWHIAPSVFHTLFAWLKRKRTLKVVLYTRDCPGGSHITRVIQELNDLCEGKHPAFDGQNRTKQVFLDGRKKTRDMRVSPSQVGSVTVYSRKPATSSLSGTGTKQFSTLVPNDEAFPHACLPKSDDVRGSHMPRLHSCSSRTNHCPQESPASNAAETALSPEFAWQAEFTSARKIYCDIHELYTGVIYDLLAEHNVVCLCFGSRKTASAACDPSTDTAGASHKNDSEAEFSGPGLQASDSESSFHTTAADVEKMKSTAFVQEHAQVSVQHSEVSNSQNTQAQTLTDPKNGTFLSRPVSVTLNSGSRATSSAGEKCCPSEDSAMHGDGERASPCQLSSSSNATSSSETAQLFPISYSLDAPLVPLPVLVDPVDYSLYHVCISAPALLNVQQGLSYLPSLKVVEVVRGNTIFDAMHPLKSSACCTGSARASNLLPAATPGNTGTLLTQAYLPTVDVASAHRAEKSDVDSHIPRTDEEYPQSCVMPVVDASTSAVQTTFLGSYLVVSPAYCVIITDPCSLLCNPEHLLRLTEQCVDCRLRQLKKGKDENDTVVLYVENAEHAQTTIATTTGGIPGVAYAASAAAAAGKSVLSSSLGENPTTTSAERDPSDANLAGKPHVSQAATGRTTLRCLDPYADLNAEEIKALHPRDYLKATIVPVLLPAIEFILKDRPEDPLAWIAFYLLRHAEGYERTTR